MTTRSVFRTVPARVRYRHYRWKVLLRLTLRAVGRAIDFGIVAGIIVLAVALALVLDQP